MAKKTKQAWAELGAVRKNGDKTSYIVLNKDVEILVKGEKVDLGKYRTVKLMDPKTSLDGLLSKGHIDEAEHSKRLGELQERNVKFKLVVPPSEND